MVSSWLPKSTFLLVVGLLSASSASAAVVANSDSDGHLQTTTTTTKQHQRRRASLRAATSTSTGTADATEHVDIDPVDDMIQDRKAGRRQDRTLKKDSKKKSSKKSGKKKGGGGSSNNNDNDKDKKDDNAAKQTEKVKQPTTSTASTFKQTATSTKPTTSTSTSGASTGTFVFNGQKVTLPAGMTGYSSPNGYYQGTSSGANTENNFNTWTVKDPSQVGRNPEGSTSSGGTSSLANVPMMSCEGGGGDDQDMNFFGVKFGQCSNADPCLAAVMPSRMAYYCPLQFRPYCGGKCYTVASACPDGKIHDAVGGTWDVSDPRWWQAESSAWGGAWPYNFGEPACTHSAASF